MDFPAIIDLSTLNGSNGFALNGIDINDGSGRTVSSAGDVNGDGFADIIISAPFADPGGDTSAGESYVVFGKAGGFAASIDLASLDGTNGFRIDGVDPFDYSARSVASAGDINGDGFDDLIIGAHNADPNGITSAGETTVIFGKGTPFAASINLQTIILNGVNGFRLNGIAISDYSGLSVSGAGDVNGDGFDDIIIGANGADPGGFSAAGEAYVVFGKASGFTAATSLGSLNGTDGFRLTGLAAGDRTGSAVSSIGDINGDGFDDIIVGARNADPGGVTNAGSAYVVLGKAGGFTATFNLNSLAGFNGFRIDGVVAAGQLGFSASSAGDFNGDGFDDFIVSGPYGGGAGESYLIFGRPTEFPGVFDINSLDGSNGFLIRGADTSDFAGFSVSGAGDVNGDGFDDVIVGALGGDPAGNSFAGESYVIFGAAGGFSASFNLANVNGTNGFRVDGAVAGIQSGISVAVAGDVNGDGFDDLVIGARYASPNGVSGAGQSYVLFGRMPTTGVTRIGTDLDQFISGGLGDDILEGRGGDDILRGQAGDDEIHGDDGADDILGGDGDDTIYGGSGNDVIDGGAGFDIIFAGSGDDVVNAGSGNDQIDTGSGNDTIVGGSGDDVMLLRIGNDIANGNGGNDSLNGDVGDDNLQGGAGNDVLIGGSGSDSLSGGSGIDMLAGGADDDNYRITDLLDTIIELANEGLDTIRSTEDLTLMANVERLFLIGGAREATGNGLDNTLSGSGGADTLSGLDGADVLRGGVGRDILLGGNGADLLDGGTGKDTMTGGAGKDTFQFRFASDFNTTRALADVITDFDQGLAERIQLSAIDANTNTGTNDDFEWIAGNAFSNTAGEMRFEQSGGDTFIEGDTNGDGVADLVIRLTGLYNLSANDIIGASDLLPNRQPASFIGIGDFAEVYGEVSNPVGTLGYYL